MLADNELIVINHDESREGEYIRIRVILLGEDLSDINLDISAFHDVEILTVSELTTLDFFQNTLESETFTQRHFLRAVPNKTRLKPSLPVFTENVLNKVTLENFINDADIVLLVADGNDKFAVKNICTIIEILDKNRVLYVKILTNKQSFSLCRDKNGVILISNVLIVENQEDFRSNAEISMVRKMEKILNTLCQVIDNEINTYRMHEYDCSALITLESFFEAKGELFIYQYNTYDDFQLTVKNDANLQINLKKSSQVWLKFYAIKKSSQEILDCIELIEKNIDEDADLYFDSFYSMKKLKLVHLLMI